MKYLPILLIFLACYDSLSPDEYFEACPYELVYGRSHYLQVPISITPHQKSYRVGDTMNVKIFFSDSIFDVSRETRFKIENFPFEPASQLYRIEEDAWQSGYRINELIVDEEKFNTRYNFQSRVSDDMRGFTVYEDDYYHFEYDLVFNTPGTYIIMTTDQYEFNTGSGLSEFNEDINAIEFEGRCPDSNFYICSIIEGDPHYYDFLDELIYLDKEIQKDKLSRLNNLDKEHFGSGGVPIEWNGVFCFEVLE